MKKRIMKAIEKLLFPVVFIIAFIGLVDLIPVIVTWVLITGAVIYLAAGWNLLLPHRETPVDKWVPFSVSYLIAQTLITVLFGIREWPMMELFAYVTSSMLLVALIILIAYRKKLGADYPVDGYIVKLIICIMFAGSPLWMQ